MIAKCRLEIKDVKQKYHLALIENLRKDVTIENLLDKKKKSMFDNFHGDFPHDALESLRVIGNTEREDSTFVLTAVRGLYSDLSTLKNKTYSGMSKNKSKDPMTPKKLEILKTIFEKRIDNIDCDSDIKRKKLFSKHVKTAIETIKRQTK